MKTIKEVRAWAKTVGLMVDSGQSSDLGQYCRLRYKGIPYCHYGSTIIDHKNISMFIELCSRFRKWFESA